MYMHAYMHMYAHAHIYIYIHAIEQSTDSAEQQKHVDILYTVFNSPDSMQYIVYRESAGARQDRLLEGGGGNTRMPTDREHAQVDTVDSKTPNRKWRVLNIKTV